MTCQWLIHASDRGVTAIRLKRDGAGRKKNGGARCQRLCAGAAWELSAYFAGRLTAFSSPYDIHALPPFARAVLKMTAKIPYGEVRSYEWIARKLGNAKAARAVGNALARNPIPIIVPCHRVVRTDGAIGGFALGAGWKKRLLNLEKTFVKTKTSPMKRA